MAIRRATKANFRRLYNYVRSVNLIVGALGGNVQDGRPVDFSRIGAVAKIAHDFGVPPAVIAWIFLLGMAVLVIQALTALVKAFGSAMDLWAKGLSKLIAAFAKGWKEISDCNLQHKALDHERRRELKHTEDAIGTAQARAALPAAAADGSDARKTKPERDRRSK